MTVPEDSPRRRLRRTTDSARISVRFARLSPKYQAFGLAMSKYADQNGQFDRELWTQAFESSEPLVILDVRGLTGTFEDLLNNLTEMMLSGARARELPITSGRNKPSAPDLYKAIASDGGLTRAQVADLNDLNWVRNQFQHSSPTITTDEAYDGIVLMRRVYRGLLQSFTDWLTANQLRHLLTR